MGRGGLLRTVPGRLPASAEDVSVEAAEEPSRKDPIDDGLTEPGRAGEEASDNHPADHRPEDREPSDPADASTGQPTEARPQEDQQELHGDRMTSSRGHVRPA